MPKIIVLFQSLKEARKFIWAPIQESDRTIVCGMNLPRNVLTFMQSEKNRKAQEVSKEVFVIGLTECRFEA